MALGLFRRRAPRRGRPAGTASPAAAIADFWAWWPDVRPQFETAISTGSYGDLVEQMSARVAAVDPGLQWELTGGRTALYALVVSAGGQRRLRAITERWRRAGPGADPGWEFHSSRQPDHGAVKDSSLAIHGQVLDLREVVVGLEVDEEREVLDLAVHHPAFPDVAEPTRATATFLALDWLLGEDGVERWIGAVEIALHRPPDSVPATALPAMVSQLASERREPRWAVLSGTSPDGRPVVATVRVPLKPVDYPLFDLHVGVALPYAAANDDELPVDPSLGAMCDLEDILVARLGTSAVFVGHESYGGIRTLHFYADSEDMVPAQIEAMCRAWSDGQVGVYADLDSAWESIEHLRL